MEEIGTTNPEYQPLQILWWSFMSPHLKNHPLGRIHLFTKQIVPSLYQESLTHILLQSVSPIPFMWLINHFLPLKNIFMCVSFFLVSFIIFIAHLFHRLMGAYVNPGNIFSNSLFMQSLCSLIPYSGLFSRGKIFTNFAN